MPAMLYSRDPTIGTPAYDAQNKGPAILVFVGITCLIAFIVVVLRLYVRHFLLKCTGADDVVMAVAMLFGIAVFICFVGQAQYGLGRHLADISIPDMEVFLHWQYFQTLLTITGIALAKISICLLLIRLVQHRRFVYFLWALLGFLSLGTLACDLVIIFACSPTAAAWNLTIAAEAKCLSISTLTVLSMVNSIVNITTDVLLALLPIPVIISMNLNARTKAALCFVMSLGLIAVGAAAVKITAQETYLSNPDRTYKDRYFVWGAIELYFGVLAASLPTLKSLLSAFLSSARNTLELSSGQRHTYQVRELEGINDSGSVFDKLSDSPHSGTVYAQCSTGPLTPLPVESKEVGSYFSFFRKHGANVMTECSRTGSIHLGQVTWNDTGTLTGRMTPEDDNKSCIIRTTRVTTTSEPAERRLPITMPNGMPAMPLPTKQLSRQSSKDSGMVLRQAQVSEEDLPRRQHSGSSSVVGLFELP